ncbi:unnamed protein product, partial [Didymodactylos carnosus]
SAFDALWHPGCVRKLLTMGIPKKYLEWNNQWLKG